MKRILAICGSRSIGGRTESIIDALFSSIKSQSENCSLTKLTPSGYELRFSEHPEESFICGADENEIECRDDSAKIKRLMEESDLIVLASPTYFANVSADMKLFIDRFCHLAHLFYFAKKPCITIVTSQGTGHMQVARYLNSFRDGLGLVGVGDIVSPDGSVKRNVIENVSSAALKAMEPSFDPIPTSSMEAWFRSMKRSIEAKDESDIERDYWREHGLLECESLREYFLKTK